MEFECLHCEGRYLYEESPSDLFCSQGCSENWTYRISTDVERYDRVLDRTRDTGGTRSVESMRPTPHLRQVSVCGGRVPDAYRPGDAVSIIEPTEHISGPTEYTIGPMEGRTMPQFVELFADQLTSRIYYAYAVSSIDVDEAAGRLTVQLADQGRAVRYMLYLTEGTHWSVIAQDHTIPGRYDACFEPVSGEVN